MALLSDPLKIKNLTIKNRICVPPMVCYHWADESGQVTEKNIRHYQSIARGGAGLIIQEAACVSPDGRLSMDQLGIWRDEQIPGLKKITQAVHDEGVPIFIQLHHAGVLGAGEDLVCPSEYDCVFRDRPRHGRAMTAEEIHQVIGQFADAAKRAVLAGYDGIEIHGCHGYLLCQFLNRRVNQRTDEFNPDSMKIIEMILDGIRSQVPDDFIIGIRLGVFEPTLEDALAHARWLDRHGIDFIDASYGFNFEMDPVKPEDYPLLDVHYGAGEIKKAVHVPVFAVNSIDSPQKAQEVLDVTGVDMVDIGRGTLVNYSWANDALAGRDTGKCLHCPQCMWRIDWKKCPGRRLLERQRGSN